MTSREILNIFTEDPYYIGSFYGKKFEVTGISYGNVLRISEITKDIFEKAVNNSNLLVSILANLDKICRVVAIACYNKPSLPPSIDIDILLTHLTLEEIVEAFKIISARIDISELWEHYGFKDKKDNKVKPYPGMKSPWATIINIAALSKGWYEFDLKWNVSFQNLLLYSLCYPSGDTKPIDGEKYDVDENGLVDAFQFFANRG